MTLRYDPDEAGLRQLLHGNSGPVLRWVTDTSRQVDNEAKIECPVDTGNLRARHEYAVTDEGNEIVGSIGSTADYAMAVHEGHRVSATASSRGRRVRVSGRVPGNPWLERALRRFGLVLRRNG